MDTAKGDCFQIIGVDIFIDKNLKPWVLEINDSPSMNMNLNKEGGKGEGLITHKSEVDKYIKTRVLSQAFKLMLKNSKLDSKDKRYQKRSEIEEHDCWVKLEMAEFREKYNTYMFAAQIFDKACGVSGGQMELSCSKFSKLSKFVKSNSFG